VVVLAAALLRPLLMAVPRGARRRVRQMVRASARGRVLFCRVCARAYVLAHFMQVGFSPTNLV
jgi:hypothetical protein